MDNSSRLDEYVNIIAAILYDTKKTYFKIAVISFLLDLMAVCIVVFQLVLLNAWTHFELSSQWSDFYQNLAVVPNNRSDGLAQLFPSLTKCTIRGYLSTDKERVNDVLYNLGLNDSYEKGCVMVFVFLVLILFVVSAYYSYSALKLVLIFGKNLASKFFFWCTKRVRIR